MIPKIIHYCWLSSDPIPKEMEAYITGWKNNLPSYEFILWDSKRFDVNSCIWVKQACEHKKYAFAADYIRIYSLYNYGGIYLDMDVQVLKTFDKFLTLQTMLCFEKDGNQLLEMATFGAMKGISWLEDCISYYTNRPFENNGNFDMKILPKIISEIIQSKYNLVQVTSIEEAAEVDKDKTKIPIFTCEYFSPKSYNTGIVTLTSNTVSIHHFAGSWLPKYSLIETLIWRKMGIKDLRIISKTLKKVTNLLKSTQLQFSQKKKKTLNYKIYSNK